MAHVTLALLFPLLLYFCTRQSLPAKNFCVAFPRPVLLLANMHARDRVAGEEGLSIIIQIPAAMDDVGGIFPSEEFRKDDAAPRRDAISLFGSPDLSPVPAYDVSNLDRDPASFERSRH